MSTKRLITIAVLLLLLLPAVALADNNITAIKPFQSYGTYGDKAGQINSPITARMDAADNLYVLQDILYNGKHRRVISVFDRNLTHVRTFNVVKTSMVQTNMDIAPGHNMFYDNIANAMDIGKDGTIYLLSGWDVLIFNNDGKYRTQFPVSSFMGWIDETDGATRFYYPSCVLSTDDGKVIVTSGDSIKKQELMFVGLNGRLASKQNITYRSASEMLRDRNDTVYMIIPGDSSLHVFNSTMAYQKDIPLQFNGTYYGNPASLAFFKDGNMTASANGIFIYYPNGTMITQFMDNNITANDRNWGRLVAVNSSNFIIVIGSAKDKAITPKPILTYKYMNGTIIGEQKKDEKEGEMCWGIFGPFYLLYLGAKAIIDIL